MTVITHSLSEKKQQKEPLVPADVLAHDHEKQDQGHGRPAPTLVRVMRDRMQPVRERAAFTSSCIFLTAFLLFCIGMAGCAYLYQQYQVYQIQQRHFRGWCGIPIAAELSDSPDAAAAASVDSSRMQALLDDTAESLNRGLPDGLPPGYFDEEFDLDLEFEKYEKIETPDFSNGQKGRFVHDFAKNKTGIVDMDAGRCFVMELNRSRVIPPRNLFDMIEKMRAGYYDIDTEVIHETYRVVTPAIPNGDVGLGSYINEECASFPIYRLERMTSPVFKRSTVSADDKTTFMEFAGNKVSQMDVVNLENAPGSRK